MYIVDRDECIEGNHMCSQFEDCENTNGSHNCFCKTGFIQEGNECRGNSYTQRTYKRTFYYRCPQILMNVKYEMAHASIIVPIQRARTYAVATVVSTSTQRIIELA